MPSRPLSLQRLVISELLLIVCLMATGCQGLASEPGGASSSTADSKPDSTQDTRAEVLFWHFWGGRDKPVVDQVIADFNASQDQYRVRGLALPGANLDLKFFLSLSGGQPPDLLNHDDQVVADWASRGALTPLSEVASPDEITELESWLYPAAKRLGRYDGQLYAVVNGLDIRALYYNATWLEEEGLAPPQQLTELDAIAEKLTRGGRDEPLQRVGYLPDPRRLWAWSVAFGGGFQGAEAGPIGSRLPVNSEENRAALRWMASYAERLGPDRVAAFRTGDQALTGASFPLLAGRRYAVMMDGQWRVRDLEEAAAKASEQGLKSDRYGVVPLPPAPGGVERAGWVNGNYFILPRGARQPAGAWAFVKYWIGFRSSKQSAQSRSAALDRAAQTSVSGGWIPVSQQVVNTSRYQSELENRPLMKVFVDLASSPHQQPTPRLPGAPYYYREVVAAAQDVLYRGANPEERLATAERRIFRRLGPLLERQTQAKKSLEQGEGAE